MMLRKSWAADALKGNEQLAWDLDAKQMPQKSMKSMEESEEGQDGLARSEADCLLQ